jgi:two-component system sensor histidine kinase DegS
MAKQSADENALREMLNLQEQEHKLVAYEIHDGLSQMLAGALFKFQSVSELRETDVPAAQKLCDEGVELLRKAMIETRRLINGLRPPILDDSDIAAAITSLIAEYRRQEHAEITFLHDDFGRLATPLERALFRITQECLTNACRYSQSKQIRVTLRKDRGHARLEVQDWGVGFDPSSVTGDHFGLRGINERVRLLGGNVTIHSVPTQGTHIIVELPLIPIASNSATTKTIPTGHGGPKQGSS